MSRRSSQPTLESEIERNKNPIDTIGCTVSIFTTPKEFRDIRSIDMYRVKGKDQADSRLKQLIFAKQLDQFKKLVDYFLSYSRPHQCRAIIYGAKHTIER